VIVTGSGGGDRDGILVTQARRTTCLQRSARQRWQASTRALRARALAIAAPLIGGSGALIAAKQP